MTEVTTIVTVFNKARYLPYVLKSLLAQEGDFSREILFVDDCSTDGSVAVLQAAARGEEKVRVIENPVNQGPSVRLNQGAALAQGRLLHFMDADDMAPQNAVSVMRDLLLKNGADLVYGRWEKTKTPASGLLGRRMDDKAGFTVTDAPLLHVLKKGGFVRMALLCEKALFEKAGGADEGIFVQDESLPLRLSRCSRRMVDFFGGVILLPRGAEPGEPPENKTAQVSDSDAQLNHDRFLAFARFLDAPGVKGSPAEPLVYKHAVSAGWKHARRVEKSPCLSTGFRAYLRSRLPGARPDPQVLDDFRSLFDKTPGIRRMHQENDAPG